MSIHKLIKSINQELFKFELVLKGTRKTMPYFDFKKGFNLLLAEVMNYNNLIAKNINIIGTYYSLIDIIEFNYEKWDLDNYKAHPDYDVINNMYVELWNTCNHEIFNFLETYAKDELIYHDDNEPLSVIGELKGVDNILNNPKSSIQNSKDLRNLIMEIIEIDIRSFIQNEGFYKPIKNIVRKQFDEDLLQKTIKIQLENAFLRRNFKNVDINRVVQNYDDKRPDFLIKHGIIGPVMIELKFLHNPQIINEAKMQEYKEKIKHSYLVGTNSEFGFYLVFKIKSGADDDKCFDRLQKEYSDIKNLNIILIDCT